jgi:hypothetical protein
MFRTVALPRARRMALFPVLASFALAPAPTDAAAKENIVAAGCIPDPASVQADLLTVGTFGVRFKPGKSGQIRLHCPIPHIEGQRWLNSFMFYRDPDGMSTSYRVRAFLRTASLDSPSVTTTICVADSNTRFETDDANTACRTDDLETSTSRWYWYEILIERAAGATDSVKLLGLSVIEH